jgi:hypothetical protein
MRSSIGVMGALALAAAVPASGRAGEAARANTEVQVILQVTCPSDAVRAAVEGHRPELVACYQQLLARRPQLSATSVFEWTVGADGRVSGATASSESAEYEDPELRDCVLARIARWTFAKPAGPVQVTLVAGFSTKRKAASGGSDDAAPASIDKVGVRKVIQAHGKEILKCYQDRLAQDPKLAGKVVMKWVIEAGGAVENPQVVDGTTLEDHALHECMKAQLATWRFPRPENGGVALITYPWIFKAQASP